MNGVLSASFRRTGAVPLALNVGLCLGVHEQRDNEAIKTQDFGENENKNHSDEKSRLLCSTTHASVSNDANGEPSGQTRETDTQTSAELDERCKEGKLLREVVGNQDGHDEAVNTNDTSHNDRNDIFDDEIRTQDTHGRDADA